jgi:hypothetical protein
MDRLYQIISRHFSQSEIANLASDLGIYVPSNADPTSMARELFSGARRNLRLDVLFYEVYSRKADLKLDLHPNLYELIAGTFSEQEAAALARKLGLDRLNAGLDAGGLIGWNNDDFFKNRKAKTLQETAEKQNKYEALLVEMKVIRPSLDLTIFQQSMPERAGGQGNGEPPPPEQQQPGKTAEGMPQTVQYIQNIYGDQYGGDRVEGGKAGGNLFKDINITGVSGSAISLGGDAVVETTIKDIQGDITTGGDGGREALLLLIEQINQELAAAKSELRERDAQEAAEDMQEVSKELQAEKPDGSWIIRKLNNVAQIAGAAGAAVSAANQLGPHIQQAIKLAQSLFGG